MSCPRPLPTSLLLALLLFCLVILPGCAEDEYSPSVICHNSNCVEPTNPGADSTIDSLEESLLLLNQDTGRPYIDGLEIDTFWWGAEERCLMAHDLDHPERAVDAADPVDLINDVLTDRLTRQIPLTRDADRFTILIELKGHVAPSKEAAHSDEQLTAHASCALDMAQQLIASADLQGYDIEVTFMSFAPALLQAIFDHPDYAPLQQSDHPLHLSILQGIPRPLDSQTVPLDEFPGDIGIDSISVHPHWTRSTDRHVYDARDLTLNYWMFIIVPETLAAISAHRPAYITTSQAPTLTSWLDRQSF